MDISSTEALTGILWGHFGINLGSRWGHFKVAYRSRSLGHCKIHLEPRCFRVTLFGVTLGALWGHFRFLLKITRKSPWSAASALRLVNQYEATGLRIGRGQHVPDLLIIRFT